MSQAASSLREAAPPTSPGLESSFDRVPPLHAGHTGLRSAVTNASKGLLQSRHRYSNKGMSRL